MSSDSIFVMEMTVVSTGDADQVPVRTTVPAGLIQSLCIESFWGKVGPSSVLGLASSGIVQDESGRVDFSDSAQARANIERPQGVAQHARFQANDIHPI